jgi:hypothetical protein
MQACDSKAKVVEFHPDDFSKKENDKFSIDGPINFLVPQNGPYSEMIDNFSLNVKAEEDIVAESILRRFKEITTSKQR